MCAVTVQAVDQHQVEAGIARLQSNPGVSLYRDRETGRLRFVSGQLSEAVASGEEINATFAFLETHQTAFIMSNPTDELELKRVDIDDLGMKHVRLDQHYRGLPVYGSNMIAHFTSDGVMKAINGMFVEDIDLDITPSISADEAFQVSLADIDAYFGSAEFRESMLLVFPWEDQNYLAWRIELFSAAPIGSWEYFIDARSGEIIYSASLIRYEAAVGTGLGVMGEPRNHIDTDFDGVEYRMIDATRQVGNDPHGHGGQMPPGNVIQTSVGNHPNPLPPDPPALDADNVWDDASQGATVDGQVWSSLMYDWMLRVLGRNSFDDAGASMWTTVDYVYDYPNNACWVSTPNGGAVVVFTAGDGWKSFAACPDVIAHEWGHAVTEHGSDLMYWKESGALSESFSDMIGTAFELAHDTLDSPDCLMGENAVPAERAALRDISNPPAYGQPDYYGGDYWRGLEWCAVHPANDYCYVHTNSGIGNKWFYLLSMGGTHNDITVEGIGIENAIRIAYRANVFYWTASTNYAEAAIGTELAADDLDPTGYWREQVNNAWEAVGVVTRPLPELTFSYPEGRPSSLMPGETTSFVVGITAIFGGSVVPGSESLHYRVDGGDVQIMPLTQTAPGRYEASLPALDCGEYIEYMIEAYESTSGRFVDVEPDFWWRAEPGTHAVTLREDDFEGYQGGKWALWGRWEAGEPTGNECDFGGSEPAKAYSGTGVLAHCLEGAFTDYLMRDVPLYATSWPYLNCSEYNTVQLTFWRWLNVEHPEFGHASIQIGTDWSSDSTYFHTVWENETEITDSVWTKVDLDISHIAGGQSTVYVRFVWGPSNMTWLRWYCGWNVDDMTVTGYECNTQADADGDQVPDYLDNCVFTHNPNQEDTDGDGIGDVCDCCTGRVGDANGLAGDEPTVGDVSVMIEAKFITGTCDGILDCITEADINQSGGVGPTCDDITIGDISTLIDYLFITGSELGLADCP